MSTTEEQELDKILRDFAITVKAQNLYDPSFELDAEIHKTAALLSQHTHEARVIEISTRDTCDYCKEPMKYAGSNDGVKVVRSCTKHLELAKNHLSQLSTKDTDEGLLNRLADLRKDKGTFPTGTWTFNPQELLDFIHVDRETAVRGALDIRKFAKDTMDIDLTSYQMETITKLANGWDERGYPEIAFGGRMIGRSALMMTLGKYLQRSIQDHQISQSLEDRV